MIYRHETRDPLSNLGRLVRALAHDAHDALVGANRFEREPLRRLSDRIDDLKYHLRDRTSTELYGWLSSLQRRVNREVATQRLDGMPNEGEGSGYFDTNLGARIGG